MGDPGKLWSMAVGWNTQGDLSFIEEGVAGDRLYLKQGGNVGIGTTNPSRTLEINGGQLGVIPASGSPGVISAMPSGNGSFWNIGNTNNGTKLMVAAGDMRAADDTTSWNGSYLTIQAGGNVGINTTGPNTKLDVSGDLALRENSPAQITANQNNYAIGSYSVLRLTSNGSYNITGFAGGVQGKVLWIINANSTTGNLTLGNESTSSTAANRIWLQSGPTLALAPKAVAMLWYDTVDSRWRVLK